MKYIYIAIAFTLYLSIYNILLYINKVPIIKQSKSRIKAKRVKESNSQAVAISKYIKLNQYRKEDLQNKIDALNLKTTPEIYIATCLIDNSPYFIVAIFVLFLSYIVGFIILIFAIYKTINDLNKINKEIDKKRKHIESEIPRFLSYIIQSFQTSKDINIALEIYYRTASNYFKKDIEITMADIQSGSQEIALKRLEQRINSDEFSKIINAIISTCIRGEENIDYLKNLEREYITKKTENLRKESKARPRKIDKYCVFILIAVIILIGLVFTKIVMNNLNLYTQ